MVAEMMAELLEEAIKDLGAIRFETFPFLKKDVVVARGPTAPSGKPWHTVSAAYEIVKEEIIKNRTASKLVNLLQVRRYSAAADLLRHIEDHVKECGGADGKRLVILKGNWCVEHVVGRPDGGVDLAIDAIFAVEEKPWLK